jgi:hypothetical protein
MMYASRRVAGEQRKILELGPSQNEFLSSSESSTKWRELWRLTILSPLVLAADLLLLLGGEVIGDVECLSDLLWRLALDHVGHGLASNIKEGLDVKIVGSLEGDLLAMIRAWMYDGSVLR